jgi:hypothetical protein
MSTGLHGLGIPVTAAQMGYFAARAALALVLPVNSAALRAKNEPTGSVPGRLPAGPDPAANGGLG